MIIQNGKATKSLKRFEENRDHAMKGDLSCFSVMYLKLQNTIHQGKLWMVGNTVSMQIYLEIRISNRTW